MKRYLNNNAWWWQSSRLKSREAYSRVPKQ